MLLNKTNKNCGMRALSSLDSRPSQFCSVRYFCLNAHCDVCERCESPRVAGRRRVRAWVRGFFVCGLPELWSVVTRSGSAARMRVCVAGCKKMINVPGRV